MKRILMICALAFSCSLIYAQGRRPDTIYITQGPQQLDVRAQQLKQSSKRGVLAEHLRKDDQYERMSQNVTPGPITPSHLAEMMRNLERDRKNDWLNERFGKPTMMRRDLEYVLLLGKELYTYSPEVSAFVWVGQDSVPEELFKVNEDFRKCRLFMFARANPKKGARSVQELRVKRMVEQVDGSSDGSLVADQKADLKKKDADQEAPTSLQEKAKQRGMNLESVNARMQQHAERVKKQPPAKHNLRASGWTIVLAAQEFQLSLRESLSPKDLHTVRGQIQREKVGKQLRTLE